MKREPRPIAHNVSASARAPRGLVMSLIRSIGESAMRRSTGSSPARAASRQMAAPIECAIANQGRGMSAMTCENTASRSRR